MLCTSVKEFQFLKIIKSILEAWRESKKKNKKNPQLPMQALKYTHIIVTEKTDKMNRR